MTGSATWAYHADQSIDSMADANGGGFALMPGEGLMFVPTSRSGAKPKDDAPADQNQFRYG